MAGLVDPVIGFPCRPTWPVLRSVHSLLQPALAVREIYVAGVFSELGLEGGDDSSRVFLSAPVGTLWGARSRPLALTCSSRLLAGIR